MIGSPGGGARRPEAPPPYRAGGEQPANDGPARQDVGAQHLVGWMDHAADVADEVAAQRLALGRGQVLSLEPVLVPLLLPETDLSGSGQRSGVRGQVGGRERPGWVTLEVMNSSLVSMSGVRRQARNFLEVRAVSSWITPDAHAQTGQSRSSAGDCG